jgi:hypothetical protein
VCNIYFSDTNISCNPDGTVHWSFVMRNNGTCTVTVPVKIQLQTRNGYSGRFTAVETEEHTYSFPPGLTTIQGDICHQFTPTQTFMNIYVKVNSTCRGGNADHLSPFIEVCSPNPTCTLSGESFSDVSADNAFSTAIYGMANQHIISGYSDGTFRPNAPATRAQTAKMIVLAFGLPTTAQSVKSVAHFKDVPAAHPLFSYVEAAYAQGLINGYSDGTFRPNAVITRGQIAKMVVQAATQSGSAGWRTANLSTATFKDVPLGSTYHPYVEAAYANGILSGYSDGTFRPDARATRGQIAQIIMLASTPQQAKYPDGVLNGK